MAITITKPTVGGSNNTWGQLLNDSLDTITDGVNGTSGTISPDLEQGAWKIGGTTITINGTELNIMDGDTSATATTVEATDRIVFNDNGVMKQVSLSDIATFMQANGHADTSSQTSVNNSGATYIQDITLDTYGHVTAITSTNVENNISSTGISSVNNLTSTGGASNDRTFNQAITVAPGQTIFGWSTHQPNNRVLWRNGYQGSPITTYGTNKYTNTGGSNVTVYAQCDTSNSNDRAISYIIYG